MIEESVIKIVDDIMGSGKSTWAINHINQNPDKKFLCIVPLLSECERFKEKTDIDIIDPEKWGSKWKNFRWLVENDKNIVTTHSLIKMMDLDMLELLKSKNYVLMIDECLDVLDTYKISKDDLKIIFNEKLVSLDEDGFLVWNEERKPYKGVYGDIKRLCSFKSLMGFKKENSDELARIIMWNFPVDFFKCFDESYIFTYLWEGSIQKSYFDIHGIKYEKYMLDYDRQLIPHCKEIEYEKRKNIVDLINIYDGKFNKIGMKIGKSNPLSKSWYEDKKKKNRSIFSQLKNNTENYFRTVTKTKSIDNMYTVFKPYCKYVKGEGYTKGFVSCNARGTNEFKNKKSLAYLINFFMSPDIKQFVEHYHIEFDDNLFSLSALLQWIWRSQIRDGKSIDLYIPSERMRELLKIWINECKTMSEAA
ncbi:DEAD/DEAH box helicase family protein [Blautia wexlerae]|uniref:DEAD/DEAH box helicase family protein n=1 Tax=Blautia wexlerae TaxID=418240 RepID=UPI00321A812C